MAPRTKKAIMLLTLGAAMGFALGISIANNGPDMITIVGMVTAYGTVSLFLSWRVIRPKRELPDNQRQ